MVDADLIVVDRIAFRRMEQQRAELLEALKEIVAWLEQGDYDESFLEKSLAAITRAEAAE